MKKGKKITLIVAGCLVLLGLILAGAGMAAIGFEPNRLSAADYHTEHYEITEAFQNISISGADSDVHLYPSESDTCKVVYTEDKDVPLEIAVEEGTLDIRRQPGPTWQVQFGIYLGETGVSVYLPKEQYDSLEIHTSSGNITVSDGIEVGSATVQSTSGEIEILSSPNGKQTVSTQSGNIHIADGEPESLQVQSTSGDITLENGKVNASIQMKSSSGGMTLTQVIVTGPICLQSTSGDIELNSCDGEELEIQTTSGNVSGTLLSEKVFQIATSSGTVDAPYSGSGGKCKITTTSGDVEFTILPARS